MRLFADVISGLSSRRSVEDKSVPLSQAYDLDIWGTPSDTGISVTRESALGYSPVWRAVSMIARDVAKIPLFVYRRLDGGGKERAREHPAYHPLRYQPNEEMSAYHFRMLLQSHALMGEGGYAYIDRDSMGFVRSLLPLNPEQTYCTRDTAGRLWYITRLEDGEERRAPAASVLHIRGLGFDRLRQYALIKMARNSIGVGLAMQKYRGRFYKSGAAPRVVLEHPGNPSERAARNIRQSFEATYMGLDGKQLAILEEGITLKPFSISPEDAQLIEGAEFQVRDVANYFGVPAHKLGDPTRTSYASLEQENQAYLDDALDGWLANWEYECWDKLLTPREKLADTHVVEFLRAAMVRADLATRTEAYNKSIQSGWRSRDEVRELENLPPMPDGMGKVFLQPLNMTPVGVGANDDVSAPADEEPSESSSPPAARSALCFLLCDTARRFCRRIADDADRAARRGGAAYIAWLDGKLPEGYRHALGEALAAPCQAAGLAGMKLDGDDLAKRFLEHQHAAYTEAAEARAGDLVNAVRTAHTRAAGQVETMMLAIEQEVDRADANSE